MNKYIYTIGRSESNNIVIDDPSVSREHLRIEMENAEKIMLEDLDSTNGTSVNGKRVKRCSINAQDLIVVGNYPIDTNFIIDQVRSMYQKESNDFTVPFQAMLSDFEMYEREKRNIFNSGKKAAYLRAGLTSVIVIILLAFPDIIPDGLRYPLILATGIIGSIFAVNSQNAGKRKDALDLLQARYEDKLKCPNIGCKAPLINRSLEAWKEVKKCRKCGAKYFD